MRLPFGWIMRKERHELRGDGGLFLLAVLAWLPWIGRRFISGLLALFAISLLVFIVTQALPSDPARAILGPDASETSVAILRQQLGFDRPFALQYVSWVRGILDGDLGTSIDSGVPVFTILLDRGINSLVLLFLVMTIVVPFSLGAGLYLATRRDRAIDRIGVTISVLLKAIPNFVIAIALVMLLSTAVFPILPAVSLLDPDLSPLAQPAYLVLPVLTLVLSVSPLLVRLIRAAAIEVMEADYIAACRLRGLSEWRVVWLHVLPNALVPSIQGLALTIRVLVGGVLIVETVFGYPGIGSLLNLAVGMRDLPVIQGTALAIAAAIVLTNIAADAATILLTPKLRSSFNASDISRAKTVIAEDLRIA